MKLAGCLILFSISIGLWLLCFYHFHSGSLESHWINVLTDKSKFDEQVKNAGNKLVVIEFFNNLCDKCREVEKEMAEIMFKYPYVVMIMVNIDKFEELANRFNVTISPTFVFLKNHEVVNSFEGIDVANFESIIKNRWISIRKDNDFDVALENAASKLVIVEFYWHFNKFIRKITPNLEKLPHKYPNVVMIKVDAMKFKNLAAKYEVNYSPTFVYLRNGRGLEIYEKTDLKLFEEILSQFI